MSNNSVQNKIFFGSLILILVAFVMFVTLSIFKPFDYKSLKGLKKTTVENCLQLNKDAKGKQSKYYVLIYDQDSSENEHFEEAVVSYANYVKKNKETAAPIYVLRYTDENKDQIKELTTSVDSANKVPVMYLVSSEKLSTKYEGSAKISNQLLSLMKEEK